MDTTRQNKELQNKELQNKELQNKELQSIELQNKEQHNKKQHNKEQHNKEQHNNKVLVGMSGGVDSSVAAALLLEKGYEVTGVTLKLWDGMKSDVLSDAPKIGKTCCSLEDAEDARSAAFSLGIPFYVLNMKDLFIKSVVDYFVAEYQEGNTPNPCVACNRHIKFDAMMKKADLLSIYHISTGHYARIEQDMTTGKYLLKKGKDTSKDQSYVLYMLKQDQLRRLLLPLGNLSKEEVRAIAREKRLVTFDKPDSQDICFVENGNYAAFIEKYTGIKSKEGNFIDMSGKVLGKHKGIIYYTTGQRKGLGLSLKTPHFVVDKDVTSNTVRLGSREDCCFRKLHAKNMNYIPFDYPVSDMFLSVKTRYSSPEKAVRLIPDGKDTAVIEFTSPQPFISKGQMAVLYDGDVVVGGGVIDGHE